jgi:DNA-binding CsgD family transcriptional regulator
MAVRRISRGQPLLEREAEVQALIALAHGAANGAGGVALVEGPAGIGKTALLEHALACIRDEGVDAVVARGGELERDLPWGVVRELFERLLVSVEARERDELMTGAAGLARAVLYGGEPEQGTGESEALARALHGLYWLTATLAERTPLVVAVDDVHWADRSSLRFIAYLAARVTELPVAIIATIRSGEPEASGRTLAEVASHPWTVRLEPAPLGEDAASELVVASLGPPARELGRACHELTAGNPFYLQELLRDLQAALPAEEALSTDAIERLRPRTVAQMVQRRLESLPGGALALARAIALLGRRASLDAAAQVAELPVEEAARTADTLVAADVLAPELPLEFVHPLVRRVVYSDTPPAERNVRHARAAELLAAAGADPGDIAAHLLATEPAGRSATVGTLAAAAKDAAARGAPDAAAVYLRRALEEPAADDDVPELVWQLGRAEAAVAGTAALPTLERALALAQEPEQRAEVALEASLVLRITSDFSHAVAMLEPALVELPPGTRLAERVEGELINVALLSGRPGRRIALQRLARFADPAEADRVHDPLLLASLAVAAAATSRPAGIAAGMAERALESMPAADLEPSVAVYVAHVLAYCDRFEAARHTADELAAQSSARGSAVGYGFALTARAQVGHREGALLEAEDDARRCMEIYRDWQADPLDPLAFLVDALVERGEFDEAQRVLERAPLQDTEGRWDELLLTASRGRLRLAAGDPRAALEDLLHCGREVGGRLSPAVMAWRSSAALAHLAVGSRDDANALAEEELDLARSFGAMRAIGIALRTVGLVRGGRSGVPLLEESVAVLSGSGARLEHARSLCELGAALRRGGRTGAAKEPLREALDLGVECGAQPLAARAREELAAAGARPRRDRLRGRDALTASELRVATMAAGGATNREIAQALFVSLRTVETHLTHAYQKLDIGSRAEIAAALERGEGSPGRTSLVPKRGRRRQPDGPG